MLTSKHAIYRLWQCSILSIICVLATSLFMPIVSTASNAQSSDHQTSNLTIETIAGTGRAGFSGDNGPALTARLAFPAAVTADKNGNIYIADAENNRIRRVDSSGNIITITGTGTEGFSGDGGPAINAAIAFPIGVATDQAGNILFADAGNNRVRRIDAVSGIITTVVGNGEGGYNGDNIPAINASINFDFAFGNIELDARGNLYIADAFNNRVRFVDATTGIITTIAGTGQPGFSGDGGPATAAQLRAPTSIAIDRAGNIYIADAFNDRVRRIDAGTKMISTIAGNGLEEFSGDNGPAQLASLSFPLSVSVDAVGNLFIADTDNLRIRRVDLKTGIITTVAGNGQFTSDDKALRFSKHQRAKRRSLNLTGDGGPAIQAELGFPEGLTIDSKGNLLIADTENCAIRLVKNAGQMEQRIQIDAANFRKQMLTISGSGFGANGAMVMVNGVNVTSAIVNQSDREIILKGKRKKLAIKKGDNQAVITTNGVISNTFVFKF